MHIFHGGYAYLFLGIWLLGFFCYCAPFLLYILPAPYMESCQKTLRFFSRSYFLHWKVRIHNVYANYRCGDQVFGVEMLNNARPHLVLGIISIAK